MVITRSSKSWVISLERNFHAKLRLFCFPCAGGGASSFRSWAKNLSSDVEVCSIELPGRGYRLSENSYTKFEPLNKALAASILHYLDKPFAFFGHSMGGLLCFELAHLIRNNYGLNPLHLFISSRHAPQVSVNEPPIHHLPKDQLLNVLRRLDGTPKTIIENDELMDLILPAFRADCEVIETYVYTPKPPLNCPITVLGGLQDVEVSSDVLEPWRSLTNAAFSMQMFQGGHFFINSSRSLVLQFLNQELNTIINKIGLLSG